MRSKIINYGLIAIATMAAGVALPASPAAAAVYLETRLENLHSGLVIAVEGASPDHGARVIQYPYLPTVTANEIMILEQEPGDFVRIKPKHTYTGNPHDDKCLAVRGAAENLGAEIVSARCTYDTVDNDVWIKERYVPTVPPIYTFRNAKSRKCLVVKQASKAAGAALIQHDCNGTHNGVWLTF